MNDIETACQLLGVEADYLQPFDTTDPFNEGVRLEGFLCRWHDHRYGSLVLLRVGETPAPQVIYATPKFHYPYDKSGEFHFPPVSRASVYEKLDGTNVLAYRYRDSAGSMRVTYKLRLAPVLLNIRSGPFLEYWKELLRQYPQIGQLPERNNCHISFEMYGARNTHLLAYKADLAVAVLFGIRPADGSVVAPFRLLTLGVPTAPLLLELNTSEDPERIVEV